MLNVPIWVILQNLVTYIGRPNEFYKINVLHAFYKEVKSIMRAEIEPPAWHINLIYYLSGIIKKLT